MSRDKVRGSCSSFKIFSLIGFWVINETYGDRVNFISQTFDDENLKVQKFVNSS